MASEIGIHILRLKSTPFAIFNLAIFSPVAYYGIRMYREGSLLAWPLLGVAIGGVILFYVLRIYELRDLKQLNASYEAREAANSEIEAKRQAKLARREARRAGPQKEKDRP